MISNDLQLSHNLIPCITYLAIQYPEQNREVTMNQHQGHKCLLYTITALPDASVLVGVATTRPGNIVD